MKSKVFNLSYTLRSVVNINGKKTIPSLLKTCNNEIYKVVHAGLENLDNVDIEISRSKRIFFKSIDDASNFCKTITKTDFLAKSGQNRLFRCGHFVTLREEYCDDNALSNSLCQLIDKDQTYSLTSAATVTNVVDVLATLSLSNAMKNNNSKTHQVNIIWTYGV